MSKRESWVCRIGAVVGIVFCLVAVELGVWWMWATGMLILGGVVGHAVWDRAFAPRMRRQRAELRLKLEADRKQFIQRLRTMTSDELEAECVRCKKRARWMRAGWRWMTKAGG